MSALMGNTRAVAAGTVSSDSGAAAEQTICLLTILLTSLKIKSQWVQAPREQHGMGQVSPKPLRGGQRCGGSSVSPPHPGLSASQRGAGRGGHQLCFPSLRAARQPGDKAEEAREGMCPAPPWQYITLQTNCSLEEGSCGATRPRTWHCPHPLHHQRPASTPPCPGGGHTASPSPRHGQEVTAPPPDLLGSLKS